MSTFKITVNNQGNITLDPEELQDIQQLSEDEYFILKGTNSYHCKILEIDFESKKVSLELNGRAYVCTIEDELDLLIQNLHLNDADEDETANLISSMPGLVLDIMVEEGQSVEKNEPLMILEAMKMENILKSQTSGRVKKICCKPGEAVDKNQLLVEIEPA